MTHLMNVRADRFANRGDRVDEGNLHGQERVGGVFDQFRTLSAGRDDGSGDRSTVRLGNSIAMFVIAAIGQRSINLAQHIGGSLYIATNDNTVGEKKIGDCRALAKKFGVGGYVE